MTIGDEETDKSSTQSPKKALQVFIRRPHKKGMHKLEHKRSSSPSVASRKRSGQLVISSNHGLPSIGRKVSEIRKPVLTSVHRSEIDTNDLFRENDDSVFPDVACVSDTLLAIQSLKNGSRSQTIAIPLTQAPGRQAQQRAPQYIHGILECQLYILIKDANNHFPSVGGTVPSLQVSTELPQLLRANKLRRLSSTTQSSHPLTILLETNDYVRAVWDAHHRYPGNAAATEWFLSILPKCTGLCIPIIQLEELYRNSSVECSEPLESILKQLQQMQVLMASHSSGVFQLWLPSWGLVLNVWEAARRKLLLQLKQSSFQERSVQALQQEYSPIDTKLLIDWMVDQGEVQFRKRPAGVFVKLLASDESRSTR